MDIKILIAMHKPYWHPDDPVYMPIHVEKRERHPLDFQEMIPEIIFRTGIRPIVN